MYKCQCEATIIFYFLIGNVTCDNIYITCPPPGEIPPLYLLSMAPLQISCFPSILSLHLPSSAVHFAAWLPSSAKTGLDNSRPLDSLLLNNTSSVWKACFHVDTYWQKVLWDAAGCSCHSGLAENVQRDCHNGVWCVVVGISRSCSQKCLLLGWVNGSFSGFQSMWLRIP